MKNSVLSFLLFFIFINANTSSFSQTNEISFPNYKFWAKNQLSKIINFKAENCSIIDFAIIRVSEGEDVVEVINKGNDFGEKAKKLIGKAKKGDKFYIEKINSLGDCIHFHFRETNFLILIE